MRYSSPSNMLSHLYVLPAKRLSGSNVEHPHLRLRTPAVPAAAVPWYSRHGFLLYSKIQSTGLCSWYLGPLLLFWAFKKCKSGSSSSSDREGGAGAAPQAAAERKRPGRKIDPEAAELRASLERPFKRPGRNDLRSIFQTCWYSCWGDVFYIDTHSQSKQAADRYRAIAKFFAHREDQYTFLEQEAQAASLPFVAYKYETPTRWSSCLLQLISVLQNNPAHALLRPVGTLDTLLCKICAVCEFEVLGLCHLHVNIFAFFPGPKKQICTEQTVFPFSSLGRSKRKVDGPAELDRKEIQEAVQLCAVLEPLRLATKLVEGEERAPASLYLPLFFQTSETLKKRKGSLPLPKELRERHGLQCRFPTCSLSLTNCVIF